MFSVSDKYINKRCGLHCKEYQQEVNGRWGIVNSKGKFTACHHHGHITKVERAEIVVKIVNEFINAGCLNTLQHFRGELDVKKSYANLKNTDVDVGNINAQKTMKSNEVLKTYMPHIYTVKDHKGVSILTLWTREKLENAFNLLDKPNYTVNSYMTELLKKLRFAPVTLYSPTITKSILQELDCRSVFDPCIGWGGRMLGTMCLDGEYTGCEPCTDTYNGLVKMKTDLALENVTLYHSPVEKLLNTKLKHKTYEMCLTSPPYFDLEVYSSEDTQSINQYKTYNEWIEVFIKQIIKYVVTHCTKYSCWSVKNFKTGEQYNLLDDIIKIHKEFKWVLDKQYSIKKDTKKGKSDGDVTYVFKRE